MELKLPDAHWRHREGLAELAAVLGADRDEARYVGGAVRDALLGIDVADIDIATRHLPDQVHPGPPGQLEPRAHWGQIHPEHQGADRTGSALQRRGVRRQIRLQAGRGDGRKHRVPDPLVGGRDQGSLRRRHTSHGGQRVRNRSP